MNLQVVGLTSRDVNYDHFFPRKSNLLLPQELFITKEFKSKPDAVTTEYLGQLLKASLSNHSMRKLLGIFIGSTNWEAAFHSGFPSTGQNLGASALWEFQEPWQSVLN